MKNVSKTQAKVDIENFFAQQNLDVGSIKKVKSVAMKYNLKLGKKRERFCKRCCRDLKNSKIRVTKKHKLARCSNCNFLNKIKIS